MLDCKYKNANILIKKQNMYTSKMLIKTNFNAIMTTVTYLIVNTRIVVETRERRVFQN